MNDPRSTTTPSKSQAQLLARGARYRLLARLLADPLQAPFARPADLDAGEASCAYLGDDDGFRMVAALRSSLPKTEEAARAAYTEMFGLVVSPESPPYEVEYVQRTDVFFRATAMADIAGYYRAFGVETDAHERPDHVTVEADFLWYLLEREVAADLLDHGDDNVEIVAAAFRSYFTDHFGDWTPSFASALARTSEAHGRSQFYCGVGRLLAHVVAEEAALLGVEAAALRQPAVTDAPAAEACAGCEVAVAGRT